VGVVLLRVAVLRAVLLRVVLAAVLSVPASGAASARACWMPPVRAEISDPFREPACRWCPGNRGLEYATPSGTAVRAVAAGHVTFSGRVAGTDYVVVRHADGRRVTYGNLSARLVSEGDVVVARALVGRTAGRFHLGVREGDRYVDPAPLIGRLGGVVRVIPSDATPPPAAQPPVVRCAPPTAVGITSTAR
jgi:murein DD-endopeptidase MepM/ murein hydrolase activator NlpD